MKDNGSTSSSTRRSIVEVKSVEHLTPAHGKLLLSYLRLVEQRVGLLDNFGGATLKVGVRRIVDDHRPSASPREQTFWRIRCSISQA